MVFFRKYRELSDEELKGDALLRNSSALQNLARGLFSALAFLLLQGAACPEVDYKAGVKREKVNAFPTYEEIWCRKIKEEPALKGKKVKFNSLYRTVEDQIAACKKACGPGQECCPGKCACPGRSNHQKKATADVGGLPGDVRAGCQKLLEICNEIKACGQNVGCEIGGYGAGAHHLAADEGVKNNAYNQCAFLKGAVGQKPNGGCKDDKKKDDKKPPPQQQTQQETPPAPPPPSAAQQAQQADDLMNQVMNPEQAEYPEAALKPKKLSSGGSESHSPETARDPATKIGPPVSNPASQITRGVAGGRESGGPGAGEKQENGEFAPLGLEKGAGKSGASSSSDFGSTGTGAGASSSARAKETNEIIAPFSGAGGNHYGGSGGRGSGSIGEASGSETAAAIKENMSEFSKMMERDPASEEEGSEIDSADGETLFARTHAAHKRSLQGGRVSAR